MISQHTTQHDAPGARRIGRMGALLFALIVQASCMMHAAPPPNLDLSTSKVTEKGLYHGTIQPQLSPIQINRIHTWTLEVRTLDGQPVEQAVIAVDGDMPQHGHGLPTRPRVSRNLGEGRYEVEGMKFNMPGWWIVNFKIEGPSGADEVTFNLVL